MCYTQVKSVHIGNVPDTADEQKLRSIFSAYGKVRHGWR